MMMVRTMMVGSLARRCAAAVVVCVWLCVNVAEARADVWRRSLQKELLLNSIQYLRRQLFACLKATEGTRGKRKVSDGWYTELRLQLDLDILKNSEDYLLDRVIQCRMKLTVVEALPFDTGLDLILSSKPDASQNLRASVQRAKAAGIQNSLDLGGAVIGWPRPGLYAGGGKAPSGYGGKTPPGHDRLTPGLGDDGEMERGVERNTHAKYNHQRPPTMTSYTMTSSPETPTTTTSTIPSVKAVTTPTPEARFLLDGRYITCDTAYVISNTFRCRNLRVNGDVRLPNMDYCPPHYDADRWRSMEDMSDRTRSAVDLLDLCATIGQELGVIGYTRHVRVVWGCDDVTPRLKWQKGTWAGLVKDNGYLHDLECTYNTEINKQ